MVIKEIKEIEEANDLVQRVFNESVAKDYSLQGREEFTKSINDENFTNELSYLGAYIDTKLVGVIATKDQGSHISLFFVDKQLQRQGIGKALLNRVITLYHPELISVNAAPYAVRVYRKLNFKEINQRQEKNGIIFIPMQLKMNY